MKKSLGTILVEHAAVTASQLKLARMGAKAADKRLGRFLVDAELVRPGDVARAVAEQSGRQYVPPELLRIAEDERDELPRELLKVLHAVPIRCATPHTFAVADPNDLGVAITLEQHLGVSVSIVATDEDVIEAILSGSPNMRTRRHTQIVIDKRESRRVECTGEIRCDYAFSNAEGQPIFGTVFTGVLRDVSLQGGRIVGELPRSAASQARMIDDDIEILCLLTPPELVGEEPIEVSGRVRWVKPDPEGSSPGELGAHWQPDNRWDASCLRAILVKEHQAEAQAHQADEDKEDSGPQPRE